MNDIQNFLFAYQGLLSFVIFLGLSIGLNNIVRPTKLHNDKSIKKVVIKQSRGNEEDVTIITNKLKTSKSHAKVGAV